MISIDEQLLGESLEEEDYDGQKSYIDRRYLNKSMNVAQIEKDVGEINQS